MAKTEHYQKERARRKKERDRGNMLYAKQNKTYARQANCCFT